jgi:hypothetical protein
MQQWVPTPARCGTRRGRALSATQRSHWQGVRSSESTPPSGRPAHPCRRTTNGHQVGGPSARVRPSDAAPPSCIPLRAVLPRTLYRLIAWAGTGPATRPRRGGQLRRAPLRPWEPHTATQQRGAPPAHLLATEPGVRSPHTSPHRAFARAGRALHVDRGGPLGARERSVGRGSDCVGQPCPLASAPTGPSAVRRQRHG